MRMLPETNIIQNNKCVNLLLTALFLLCVAAGLTGCSATDEADAENTPVLITADAPSIVSVSNTFGLSLTKEQKE